MLKKKVSNNLRGRILDYLQFIWDKQDTINDEETHNILNELNKPLYEELMLETKGKILMNLNFFSQNFSEKVLKKTIGIIQERYFLL